MRNLWLGDWYGVPKHRRIAGVDSRKNELTVAAHGKTFEPFAETMLSAVSAGWYMRTRRSEQKQPPKIVFDEYVRCFTRKTITGACRDYRAAATCDFEMDTADKDRKIGMPMLLLFGTRGLPPSEEYPTVWRNYASNLVGAEPLPTGHYMQEEAPGEVYDRFVRFFTA